MGSFYKASSATCQHDEEPPILRPDWLPECACQNSSDAKFRRGCVFGCLNVCLGQTSLVQNVYPIQARGIWPKGPFLAIQVTLVHPARSSFSSPTSARARVPHSQPLLSRSDSPISFHPRALSSPLTIELYLSCLHSP